LEPNKISVVIVSFNRADALRKSLAALGADHQILVVDNGSRDGAASLDDEFPGLPNIRFSRLPRNFGLTRALNIGIRAAEGDYVLLLHDDVLIDSAAVTTLAEFLESRSDVGAVCPLLNTPQVRALPTPSESDPPLKPAANIGGDEIVVECVSGAAIMVRTTFLRSLGHIDERYGNYGSAIELSAQVRSANRKLVILRNVTATHDTAPSPAPKGPLDRDRTTGTAEFLGKHHGFMAGMLYRLKTFAFVPGKIDGSQ
jgi:N-acetylglucosaminyl-diphospho-decaprenol L-rhamnosyltransferase